MASQTALNTNSTSTSSDLLAATHAATALATTDDDPLPPILDYEQKLFCYKAQIDQCVRILKTKKDLEQYLKQTAVLLACVWRSLPQQARVAELIDENDVLLLHHRQIVQSYQGTDGFSHVGDAREARTCC